MFTQQSLYEEHLWLIIQSQCSTSTYLAEARESCLTCWWRIVKLTQSDGKKVVIDGACRSVGLKCEDHI